MVPSILLQLVPLVPMVWGHGRLVEPPSRASMWRSGFPTPPDHNDNQGWCGGFHTQWEVNGGRCGVCGDAWDAEVKEHEAPGGKYATGTIVREYTTGQTIDISIDITANHMGSFTFKLCRAPSAEQDPSQDCLDEHVLTTSSGEEEWQLPNSSTGVFDLQVELPEGYTCEQCLLQWTYRAANNWGICQDGTGAVGCGRQEHFRACADVRIEDGGTSSAQEDTTTSVLGSSTETMAPATSTDPEATTLTTTSPTTTATSSSSTSTSSNGTCQATGPYTGAPGMDDWCEVTCHHPTHPYCPPTHCKCS